MATNQRTGIIAKYAKDLGLTGAPSFSAASPSVASPVTFLPSTSSFSGFGLPSMPSMSSIPSMPTFSGFGLPSLPASLSLASSGGYILEVFFYIFLYGLVGFFILLLIHYSIYPVFQFTPGSSGLIEMSTTNDFSLYWVEGVQPTSPAPNESDKSDALVNYNFEKHYSLSVDIYITDLIGRTGLDRLIFYSSTDGTFNSANLTYKLDSSISLAENFARDALGGVNMICYVADETNDLIVTYFVKTSTGALLQKSSIPIQNIPLFTPVRITIVYDNSMFSVYYNGLQISQTSMFNTIPRSPGRKQHFYANRLDSKCGYVQTLMLWNRPILYPEIVGLKMALTGKAKFNVVEGTKSTPTCGSPTAPPSK